MVVGAFPIAKLGALLLKQISKPIANAVKQQAKTSPVFKKYVCLPPAQVYNWFEEKAKMWILNLGKPVSVPVYSEKMAIELGADLLGEGIIFLIAAGILVAEYNRSSRKEAAKEEIKQQEMDQLKLSLRELFVQTEEQGAYIRELRRKVGELDSHLAHRSVSTKSSKDEDDSRPPTFVTSDKILKSEMEEITIPPLNMSSNFNLKPCNCFDGSSINENILLKAINDIEIEFLNYTASERTPGNVLTSLDYLYKNVYRIENISFI